MTCKDCIYYEACEIEAERAAILLGSADMKPCGLFKDKSRIVELPCNVGDTFYWINYLNHSIETDVVVSIHIYEDGFEITTKTMNSKCISGYSVKRFWEIMFPTIVEAEKALERMKEE